jgi:uncharacterized damage-inducible protein DinB
LHDAIRILNHVHVVDRIFEANLQGLRHGYTALNTPDTPALSGLHEAVRKTDAWYLSYIWTLSEPEIAESLHFPFVDGSPGRKSRREMLAHVVTHGGYHRGAA